MTVLQFQWKRNFREGGAGGPPCGRKVFHRSVPAAEKSTELFLRTMDLHLHAGKTLLEKVSPQNPRTGINRTVVKNGRRSACCGTFLFRKSRQSETVVSFAGSAGGAAEDTF